MKREEFLWLLEHRASKTVDTFRAKNEQYGADSDAFRNFRRAAALEGCTPERALRGFLTKHIVSIYDMIDDLERGVPHAHEEWDEKIGDSIVYLNLLDGLIAERMHP